MTPFEILITGLAVSSISMTISLSNSTKWARDLVSKLGRWPRELVQCPYCLSHWLAAGFVGGQMGLLPWWEFIITAFGVITIASLASLGIANLFITLYDTEEETPDGDSI
jgi:hypothetical protein